MTADRTIPVIIDQSYPCRPAPASVVLDGKLNEWPGLPLRTGLQPLIIGPTGQWQGPGDASLEFTLAHDDKMLYCVGEVTDDAVTADDTLEFRLDPRPIEIRKANRRIDKGTYHFQIGSLQQGATATLKVAGTLGQSDAVIAARPSAKGYSFELAIPIDVLTKSQSVDWRGFQLTGVVNDVDQPNETPSRIVWRGSNDIDSSNFGYGQIIRSSQ